MDDDLGRMIEEARLDGCGEQVNIWRYLPDEVDNLRGEVAMQSAFGHVTSSELTGAEFAVDPASQNQATARNLPSEEPPYGTFVLPLVGSIPVCETLLSNGANEVVIRSNDNEIPFEEWVPFTLGPEPESGQPQMAHFAVYIDLYRLDPRLNTEFDVDIFVEGDTACEALPTAPVCHCKQYHISYVAADEAWYYYDGRENLVQKISNGDLGEQFWFYYYDAHDRMTSYMTPDETTREFMYDPAGRMIGSRTNENDWDTHMVSPGWEVLADMDKHLAPERVYVSPGGMDNQIAMIYDPGAGWKTLFYLRDHLGSVLALATPEGDIVESYEYEPYGLPTIYDDEGEIVASRTSTVGNRFMFTGREWEPDGEFYHYRHRTYSPHEKRFMQRDPIGLAGGWNVYAYCGGDPVNWADPMGLERRVVRVGDSVWAYHVESTMSEKQRKKLDTIFANFEALRGSYDNVERCLAGKYGGGKHLEFEFVEKMKSKRNGHVGEYKAAPVHLPPRIAYGPSAQSAPGTTAPPWFTGTATSWSDWIDSVYFASVLFHELQHAKQNLCGGSANPSGAAFEIQSYTDEISFLRGVFDGKAVPSELLDPLESEVKRLNDSLKKDTK